MHGYMIRIGLDRGFKANAVTDHSMLKVGRGRRSCSLGLSLLVSVVEQMERILVELSFLIKEDRCACLSLELSENKPVSAGDAQDFELYLDALDNRGELFLGFFTILGLGRLVDLLFVVEVHFPVGIGDRKLLATSSHLLGEF